MAHSLLTMTVDGQSVVSTELYDVMSPDSGNVIRQAPNCTQAELDDVIEAAGNALTGWSATGFERRREYLGSMATVIAEHAEELAELLVLEHQISSTESMKDILAGCRCLLDMCALQATGCEGGTDRASQSISGGEGVGVVVVNLQEACQVVSTLSNVSKVLLSGNTAILRPAEASPLTILRIGELVRGVFPHGVLNVIAGCNRLDRWLSSHDGVDKVSSASSVSAGRNLLV